MKKKTYACMAVILAAGMMLFSGCGQEVNTEALQQTAQQVGEAAQSAAQTAVQTATQIANPWIESTVDSIKETIGEKVEAPKEAGNVTYRILMEQKLAEITFTLNDMDFVARVKPVSEFEDISGLYYDWTVEDSHTIGKQEITLKRSVGDDKTVDLALWYDSKKKLMYSLTTEGIDLDGFDITAVVSQFMEAGN